MQCYRYDCGIVPALPNEFHCFDQYTESETVNHFTEHLLAPAHSHSTLVCPAQCLMSSLFVNCGGNTCHLCLLLECVIQVDTAGNHPIVPSDLTAPDPNGPALQICFLWEPTSKRRIFEAIVQANTCGYAAGGSA